MLKKFTFLMSMAAMLLAAGCSSEKDEPNVGGSETGDGTPRYLTVAISGLPDAGSNSRAGEQFGNQQPGGNADYEYGSEQENTVNDVRFYFFNSDGSAANVKLNSDGTYSNYCDWHKDDDPSINDNNGDDAPNIEKTLKATIVINTKAGDHLPAKMMAVVNPSNQLGGESRDLASLRNVINNYKNSISDYGFTMSTSVYLDLNGNEVNCVSIPDECIQNTPEGAMLQPVVMYVERVVAKVRLKVDSEAFGNRLTTIDGKTAIALVDAEGNEIKAEGKQVYAVFTNWNLTGTTRQSWLNKHVSEGWASKNEFNSWNWNYPTFFRCFWAYNCTNAGRDYFSFNELVGATGQKFGTAATQIYCQENAASNINALSGIGEANPTCGIMGAVLCYADGTPVEFYKFLGETHLGESNLIDAMLSSVKSKRQLYSGQLSGGQKVFSDITAEDVTLETAAAAGMATLDNSTKGRYHVYLTLSKSGQSKRWYSSDSQNVDLDRDFMSQTDVIRFLQSTTGSVSLWKEGMTYYYFPVEHLGVMNENNENYGKYGIVRNHIYDATITRLYGLGTPVYNPDETIYPEKPEDNDSFIAAQIDILSWRLVKSNVELEWPN